MDLRKKIFILIICLTVLIFALIIAIKYIEINKNKKDLLNQENEYLYTVQNPGMIINGLVPEELKNANWAFTIKNCIDSYNIFINEKNSIAVYSLLDKEYIKNNNLTQNNVIEFVNKENVSRYYRIAKIYQITGIKYGTYYVEANSNNNEIFYIVNIDDSSKSFSIIPIEKKQYQQYISTPIKQEQSQENTVEKNSYNSVMYNYDSEEEIVDRYLQDYLETALFNTEIAYDLLDKQYKQLKFGSIEEYKKYIEARKEQLETMCKKTRKKYNDFENYMEYEKYYQAISVNGLDKYKTNTYNGTKQYICIDTYGNYYVFNMNSIMNYTMMLDTYTLDLPEFTEKYKSANNQEKTALNIEKIVNALNDGDYKYVYGKLADLFKSNYFKNVQSFEQYAKNTFGENMKMEYNSFTETSNYCTYKITLKNENQEIEKTIIMDLQEGTNFVFSFNVN